MFKYKKLSRQDKTVLWDFLGKVDALFPIPLSHKQDIETLCDKLLDLGVVISAYNNLELAGVICGYINDTENKTAYLSVLCVSPEFQGQGIAKHLVEEFMRESKIQGMEEMFLYTRSTNERAIGLYKKLGFKEITSDREGDMKLHISFKG